MEKKHKMMEDHLEVVTTREDTVFLQVAKDQESEDIGTYLQTTVQKINPDKIPMLELFLEEQITSREVQIVELKKQLEKVGEAIELDDKLVAACTKQIGKGTKVFKQKMLALSNNLEIITRKKALTAQLEYLEGPLDDAKKELADFKEAVK